MPDDAVVKEITEDSKKIRETDDDKKRHEVNEIGLQVLNDNGIILDQAIAEGMNPWTLQI